MARAGSEEVPVRAMALGMEPVAATLVAEPEDLLAAGTTVEPPGGPGLVVADLLLETEGLVTAASAAAGKGKMGLVAEAASVDSKVGLRVALGDVWVVEKSEVPEVSMPGDQGKITLKEG
jgi:hypothetical protein